MAFLVVVEITIDVGASAFPFAAKLYELPAVGTMAHSYIQSYESEFEAFQDFAQIYPQTILLVDSYDTLAGVDKVIALSRQLGDAFRVRAVRLDSGDLGDLAVKSRARLDAAGLNHVEIFASSSLDEYKIDELVAGEAPIQGFGVGTKMGVSEDAPSLDIAYKLCAYAGTGRVKLSTGKPILPGRKQVFRVMEDGTPVRDVIARADEALEGTPLLAAVMRDGTRLNTGEVALDEIREHANSELNCLPTHARALEPSDPPYPVSISEALSRYHEEIKEKIMHAAAADHSQ